MNYTHDIVRTCIKKSWSYSCLWINKNSHNKTNKCINVKVIFFYTQFSITSACFDLSWSSWTSVQLIQGCWQVLNPTREETSYSDRWFSVSYVLLIIIIGGILVHLYTRVGTLIVATIYLQLIQNRYMFRSFTVLTCSHQHCVQPVASDMEVAGYL